MPDPIRPVSEREGGDAPSGFANVFKPMGVRSTQVVTAVRRALGGGRVGHCGTLDPLAAGVLPLALGRATRLSSHVMRMRKTYLACVLLGVSTASDDLEGAPLGPLRAAPSVEEVEAAISGSVGTIRQRPPAMSAVHVGGRRAYDIARSGGSPDLPAREVNVYAAEPLAYGRLPVAVCDGALRFADSPSAVESLLVAVRIECSTGTYVRSIARDLGQAIGCGATVFGLIRCAVGSFALANATELWQLETAVRLGHLDRILFPPDAAVEALPAHVVTAGQVVDILRGRDLHAPPHKHGPHRVYDTDGDFVGVLSAAGGSWRGRRILIDAA